jgi:two-component system, cell cycle sensor histidine kinase and response regulator CckA
VYKLRASLAGGIVYMSTETPNRRLSDEEYLLLRKEVTELRMALDGERRASRLVKEELSLLESVVDQCPVPMVVVTGREAAVRCVNRAARAVLELTAERCGKGQRLEDVLCDRTWRSCGPDGTLPDPSTIALVRALRGEVMYGDDTTALHQDGQRPWEWVSGSTAGDRQGWSVATLTVFPDIAKRKQVEDELRVAHERLDLALDGADLGIWDWNLATGVVTYDDRWAGMLGYTRDELEPTVRTWEQFVHPDDVSLAREVVATHFQGRTEAIELEHRLRCKDGTWIWVLSRGKVCDRDEHGEARRVAGTHLNITERKLHELARQAAEQHAREHSDGVELLMKSMTSAFVVWRTVLDERGELVDFYFDYFNDAYARVSGVNLAEVKGRSVREVWPTTEQSWYDVYGEIARTGVSTSFEMYHRPTRALYACSAYRLPHQPDRICVVSDDVTERKAMLVRLQNLASQQHAILNAVPAGISLLKERRLQWINPAFARMFGYAIDDLVGRRVSTLYTYQCDAERVGLEGYEVIFSGRVYATEVLFQKKDGTPMWCYVTGQAVDPDDPSQGSIWTWNDTTERRRTEVALRDSEQRFKHLVQHSSDTIVVTDESFVITSVSESAVRSLGYDPIELVGRCGIEFAHIDDVKNVREALTELVRTPNESKRIEFRGRHKDGHWVMLEVVATNLLSDSSVTGIVYNVRDISERSRLTEQLQQAMKMEAVGRLAGGIAHDFNNLLTVISGSLELATTDISPGGESADFLVEAASAAGRASALTRQLLAFSRRQIIEPKVVNLNELLEEIRKLLARVIGEDISLHTILAVGLGAVRVDPGQIEQVVVNLAVNARDAMPHGGKLILETENVELDANYARLRSEVVPGKYVLLTVSDTGVGMTDQVKQRLFEPFFTTKPKGRGTGLGLATIFGTVKQSGGSIEVYSELGKGTTFKVYLPQVEAQPERVRRLGVAPTIPVGRETVLLVEDDDHVRNLGQAILQKLGYVVLTASSGGEAIHLAGGYQKPINLLMTDVIMPGMNGCELADVLGTIHPEARVLFASGYTENTIVHHSVVDEDTNFIGKPYTVQGLAVKIRQVLDGGRSTV